MQSAQRVFWDCVVSSEVVSGLPRGAGPRVPSLPPEMQGNTGDIFLLPCLTGRPGYRTMEMIRGSSASYLARTPCVPLFCILFSRGGKRRAFIILDYHGRAEIMSIVWWNLRLVIFDVKYFSGNWVLRIVWKACICDDINHVVAFASWRRCSLQCYYEEEQRKEDGSTSCVPFSTQTLPTAKILGELISVKITAWLPTEMFPELFLPRLPKSLARKSVKSVSQSVIITEKILRYLIPVIITDLLPT